MACAQAPPHESGGISGRTGERHPLWMLEMGLEMGEGEEGKIGGKTACERERGEGWLHGGDVNAPVMYRIDAAAPTPPVLPRHPPPCPLTTRPKNVLRMESG